MSDKREAVIGIAFGIGAGLCYGVSSVLIKHGMSGMAPPGSDEAMAFGKILEFIEDSSYDRVIFDTAPTGHTLKLLELPDILDSWLGKLLTLRQRLSSMMAGVRSFFGGGTQEDTSWEMLQRTKEKIKVARVELSDPETTQFVVVMIPEAMAVFETQRLLASLNTWKIPAANIVINQLVQRPDPLVPVHLADVVHQGVMDILEILDTELSDIGLVQELQLLDQVGRQLRLLVGLRPLGQPREIGQGLLVPPHRIDVAHQITEDPGIGIRDLLRGHQILRPLDVLEDLVDPLVIPGPFPVSL